MIAWFWAFALTQLVEVPIYLAFSRPLPVRWRLVYAFGASLITHPLVWLFVLFGPGPFWALVAVAEVFAFGVEAGFGKVLGVRRPWLASLTANSASILIGMATRAAFGWP